MSAENETLPDIDRPEQQQFAKFFRSLSQPIEKTIRLFERDSNQKRYYTFHDEDALFIAHTIYNTTTVVKGWDAGSGKELPTTSLSSNATEAFLRDALLNRQLRIEIWVQKKGTSSWQVSQRASPGNLQEVEDLLFLDKSLMTAPVVLAVKLSTTQAQRVVGISFADTSVREIGITEFIDNELYSNFESLVIQLGVKECLMPIEEAGIMHELSKLRNILERCNVVITERRKGEFDTKNIVQDLNRLLNSDMSVTALPEFNMKIAMAGCACLISYLSLLNDESNFNCFRLRRHDLSHYMRLDGSALNALNLMPDAQEGARKTTHLYGILNQCKTAHGSRLLAQWLKQPLLNLEEIVQRQDIVEVFYENTELRQLLHEDSLKKIPDLHRLSRRFHRGVANLEDVVRIHEMIVRLPVLLMCLKKHMPHTQARADLIQTMYIDKIKECYEILVSVQDLVENTIDLEAVARHEFIIKPEFNEDLQEIDASIQTTRSLMDDEHIKVCNHLSLDTEKKLKLENHSTYGYCLRILKTNASAIRNKPAYIEYSTQKTGTYFTTSKLKSLNDTYNDLQKSYQSQQSQLAKEVIKAAALHCSVYEMIGSLLGHMDVLVSFAHVAISATIPYVRPTMTPMGQGNIVLRESRHPCLEVQNDVFIIPNDVVMVRGDSEFHIITGPNMGGKSTYIRQSGQIGVIALMAQTGCFVPCAEATLCLFDSILARVGAGDSQLKGVSTFMAEMLETATILRSSTRHSLIIIDELGRGTGTGDGFGLAWAISEHIATEINAFCLFATHFHELTKLSEKLPHVKNLHVTVDVSDGEKRDIVLLYKVEQGVCDQSFGIHVAELADFPSSVVTLAKRKVVEMENEENTPQKKCTGQDMEAVTAIQREMIREISALDPTAMGETAFTNSIHQIKAKYQGLLEQHPYLWDRLGGV
ncbi:DNA mismatch repair protein-like protein msh-2 [Spinellus fusiger]|nr:DNA mismatch repair protein-like protein msh-2 [Spinellus fusiger]